MAQPDDRDATVAVVRCEDYAPDEVDAAVRRAIELLGGIGRFVAPGESVLLKPNLLQGQEPERCVTTHPAVVAAVARLLAEHGCRVVIGDSPGAGIVYSEANLRRAYARSGFAAVAEETGAVLNYDTGSQTVPFPEGRVMKQFPIIAPALEADAIVVVSKVKTHMWTRMTGAAKNLFGLIPGLEKPVFHFRFRDEYAFGEMLVDLNECMKPRLQVVDAVIGMEGDGPQAGSPRKIGAILAGSDYAAVDTVLARLIGMDPLEIGSTRSAAARGLADPAAVRTVGDELAAFAVPDFKKPSTYAGGGAGPWRRVVLAVVQRFGRTYAPRPGVVAPACIGCGKCERICPVQAITIAEGRATIDLARCIRCYCCHEICTEHAIALSRSLTGRLLARLFG
ncbi:DUF362 domain-containing protein [Methanoculleus sp. Wushi-C6]|uniref:DUF362 domain-containing protein n=1 Tax=Methanoculleus caldifontis TaxID=2651577 RepID=A0ABU3WZW4_9EURY|nr:DUF362 domain-containing protein [Methanoculleus sp. Wushi-C6]MDV2481335.1 DUF362 domain-containing protein [Methanoculleus sp. Wushi-C6]